MEYKDIENTTTPTVVITVDGEFLSIDNSSGGYPWLSDHIRNAYWFKSIDDAKDYIETFRVNGKLSYCFSDKDDKLRDIRIRKIDIQKIINSEQNQLFVMSIKYPSSSTSVTSGEKQNR